MNTSAMPEPEHGLSLYLVLCLTFFMIKLFGRRRGNAQPPEFGVFYRGGHPLYPPTKGEVKIRLSENEIEISKAKKTLFTLRYEDILDVKSETREKISIGTVIVYALLGLFLGAIIAGAIGALVLTILGIVIGILRKDKHHFLLLLVRDEFGHERRLEFEGSEKTVYNLPRLIYERLRKQS